MITLLIYLAIFVIVAALICWILQQFPLPPPIDKLVMVIFVVVCVIVLISILLQLGGGGPLHMPRLR